VWRSVYQLMLILAWPWVQLRLRWRARREPGYGERTAERFGRTPADIPPGCLWFHTVSAGETIAAAPLISRLAAAHPDLPILVTTMTPTGAAQVQGRLGGRVRHCYAPYDFPWAVRRFYDRIQPRLLVLVETELWPNLLREASTRGVPALLINARLSERSARGYRRLGGFARGMLESLKWIVCQYPDHARRFEQLGVAPERVLTYGSVKFDLDLPADHAARVCELAMRWGLNGQPVWIAGSTHDGEEAIALAAHRLLLAARPDARLILVPRHPARADAVETLCRSQGLTVARQSRREADESRAQVLLGDTMGDLLYLYGLADVAFVGGSLVDVGGHNPIEPAACGKPILIGPRTRNFTDVVALFRSAGCLEVVADAEQLGAALERLVGDPAQRADQGLRARAVVTAHGGATARLEALLGQEIAAALRRV
jgi:3-deoxy-D-manno-octulosonic-acid transferase